MEQLGSNSMYPVFGHGKNSPMKLPSEAELIELENTLAYWLADSWNRPVCKTLETLIALARDPSQLLRGIPDDDAIDRIPFSEEDLAEVRRAFPPPVLPRTVDPEPASKARPKQKGKSR